MWEAITKETIVRSFEACGITTSDPDRIHCTSNASGLALAAYPVLKSFHVRLTQSMDTNRKESDDIVSGPVVMRTLQRMQMKMKRWTLNGTILHTSVHPHACVCLCVCILL